jgi:hypothetical protein
MAAATAQHGHMILVARELYSPPRTSTSLVSLWYAGLSHFTSLGSKHAYSVDCRDRVSMDIDNCVRLHYMYAQEMVYEQHSELCLCQPFVS